MISNYGIDFARSSEASGIALLSKDAIERGLSWSWTPQRVLRSVHDPATNTIVTREREMLTGFAIMKYGDEQAHLLLMAVHASRRRQGVGAALLDWLEVSARTAGIVSIRIEARATNAAARAFYGKHGYRKMQTLRGYYEGQDDAVLLTKTLRLPA